MVLGDALWRYECPLCGRSDRHTHGLRHSTNDGTAPPRVDRRIRGKRVIITCLCVALVAAVVGIVVATETVAPPGMAPPRGFAADQLVVDDQFTGTSLDASIWNTAMGGQGNDIWNSRGLPAGDSAAGTTVHQTFFSPSQVKVSNGLTLSMVPDNAYASLGYGYKSGVVTTRNKLMLRSGFVQIKAKMPDVTQGSWPAIWFIDPNGGGGSQEIDLQEGGFTASSAELPTATPANNVFVSTYHTPSSSQSAFGFATPSPMNAGFHIYGMEYDPGRSIKTYFDGHLVGSWTHDVSTTPYELVIWNSQASTGSGGYHTTGVSPNPSDLLVAEVQAYALPS